jgi:hypothetical protein
VAATRRADRIRGEAEELRSSGLDAKLESGRA